MGSEYRSQQLGIARDELKEAVKRSVSASATSSGFLGQESTEFGSD